EHAGREQVLLVVEPPLLLGAVKNAPVPIGMAADNRQGTDLEIATHPLGIDDPSVAGLGHVEPALTVPLLVIVAMGEEWPQLQRGGGTGDQPVTDHGAVGLVFHPDPLLDAATLDRPAEHRQ